MDDTSLDDTFIKLIDAMKAGQCIEFYFADAARDFEAFAIMHDLYVQQKATLFVVDEDENRAPCPKDFAQAAQHSTFLLLMLPPSPSVG